MSVNRIPIRNVTDHDLNIHIEPWGERHVLVANDSLDVVFYSQKQGLPEVLCGDGEVSIYGWEGCEFFVLRKNLCVEQPGLADVIRQLCPKHGIPESMIADALEWLEFGRQFDNEDPQMQIDASYAWDETGREAAFSAVRLVAPMLSKSDDDNFVWNFCQKVLHSRGIFLSEDKPRKDALLDAFRNCTGKSQDEITRQLNDWNHETHMREDHLHTIISD